MLRAGRLRVVPCDGPRVHGLSSTLYIGTELWAWPDGQLLEAMQTGLVERRDSKLLAISTAAAQLDPPLGRLRAEQLAQPTATRTGAVVEATGTGCARSSTTRGGSGRLRRNFRASA